MVFFAGLLDAFWDVNAFYVNPTITYHVLSDNQQYERDIARMLHEEQNIDGNPKLFIISCTTICMREVLMQVIFALRSEA